jgi:hypothetical protein
MSTLLAILDKTFSDPRLPSELVNLKGLARASLLLGIATSAYVTSELEIGRDALRSAFVMCSSLATDYIDFLVDKIAYRILGLSLDNPDRILQQITQDLPGDDNLLLKRRLWGRFYEIAAFQSHQLGQRAKCIAYVIRAAGMTPSCLRNRGLLSIFLRSFIGNRITNEFKSLSSDLRRGEVG